MATELYILRYVCCDVPVTNFSVFSTLTGVSFFTAGNGYTFYNCSHGSRYVHNFINCNTQQIGTLFLVVIYFRRVNFITYYINKQTDGTNNELLLTWRCVKIARFTQSHSLTPHKHNLNCVVLYVATMVYLKFLLCYYVDIMFVVMHNNCLLLLQVL